MVQVKRRMRQAPVSFYQLTQYGTSSSKAPFGPDQGMNRMKLENCLHMH